MTIREILFPSDLTPESDLAFDHARLLAERFGAALTLYHVADAPEHRHAHWAFAHGHEIWEHAVKGARECLERRSQGLSIPHSAIVERKGSVPRAILEKTRELRPDLTVMGAHHSVGLAHPFLGSVTESVLQQSCGPVLCVRAPEHSGSGDDERITGYRRIVVPTDLSLRSRRAFPMAAALARAFEAEVIAVYVSPPTSLATLSGMPPDLRHEPPPTTEASLWSFMRSEFDGVGVTAEVHQGPVWERICHVAREEEADLIVLSKSGHDSLADRLIGSNAARVVRRASCPVLAV
jgi:nucleotide-binding universal stress UspA family protein